MKSTILLVDDEQEIRRFIRLALKAEGFDYLEASTVEDALQQMHNASPDLVILDLGLPDADGFTLLRKIRETSRLPVLVLSARDQEREKIKLLEGGANDYITKPFSVKELLVRIRVLLRDIRPVTRSLTLDFGTLKIDAQSRKVYLGGQLISLTNKEYAVLYTLAEHAQELVNQQYLLAQIWGASHEHDSHYVRIVVSQLRKKLADDASAPAYIETHPGVGYRFLLHPMQSKHDS